MTPSQANIWRAHVRHAYANPVGPYSTLPFQNRVGYPLPKPLSSLSK